MAAKQTLPRLFSGPFQRAGLTDCSKLFLAESQGGDRDSALGSAFASRKQSKSRSFRLRLRSNFFIGISSGFQYLSKIWPLASSRLYLLNRLKSRSLIPLTGSICRLF